MPIAEKTVSLSFINNMLTMVATIGSTQDIDEATPAGIFRMAKVYIRYGKAPIKKPIPAI